MTNRKECTEKLTNPCVYVSYISRHKIDKLIADYPLILVALSWASSRVHCPSLFARDKNSHLLGAYRENDTWFWVTSHAINKFGGNLGSTCSHTCEVTMRARVGNNGEMGQWYHSLYKNHLVSSINPWLHRHPIVPVISLKRGKVSRFQH